MEKVKTVNPLPGYKLEVELRNGRKGIFSVEDRLFGPIFEPLKDWKNFSTVSVDDFGVICWPNGADLAPEFVSDKVQAVKA
jgi:Protein of unknown function (DUF2442)